MPSPAPRPQPYMLASARPSVLSHIERRIKTARDACHSLLVDANWEQEQRGRLKKQNSYTISIVILSPARNISQRP